MSASPSRKSGSTPAFRVTQPWTHPSGIFPATLAGWEEVRDCSGVSSVRWFFETSVEDPQGERVRLLYTTSLQVTPKNAMGRLLQAFRHAIPVNDTQAASIDPDEMIGTQCLVRVQHFSRRSRLYQAGIGAFVADVLPWSLKSILHDQTVR